MPDDIDVSSPTALLDMDAVQPPAAAPSALCADADAVRTKTRAREQRKRCSVEMQTVQTKAAATVGHAVLHPTATAHSLASSLFTASRQQQQQPAEFGEVDLRRAIANERLSEARTSAVERSIYGRGATPKSFKKTAEKTRAFRENAKADDDTRSASKKSYKSDKKGTRT